MRELDSTVVPGNSGVDRSSTPETSGGHGLSLLALICAAFARELSLASLYIVEAVLAAVAGNLFLGSDPCWLLLIGPSSGGKTEILRPLDGLDRIVLLSMITSKTLASGHRGKAGNNSLLPMLDGKILIIKDFTTVIDARDEERKEILSQLREVYDGKFSKAFGNGEFVDWSGKVGCIAGVTPEFDRRHGTIAVLGPRFLTVRLPEIRRREVALRALTSADDHGRRNRLADAVGALSDLPEIPFGSMVMPPEGLDRLVALADMASRARTPVERDGKDRHVSDVPLPESPARLVKQLQLLAAGRARVDGRHVINDSDLAFIRQVALDTVSPPLRAHLLVALAAAQVPMTVDQLAQQSGRPRQAVRRCLEELTCLGLVDEDSAEKLHRYELTVLAREALVDGPCISRTNGSGS